MIRFLFFATGNNIGIRFNEHNPKIKKCIVVVGNGETKMIKKLFGKDSSKSPNLKKTLFLSLYINEDNESSRNKKIFVINVLFRSRVK